MTNNPQINIPSDNDGEEEPQVFAVSWEKDGIRFSRRDFIELAGAATGMLVGLNNFQPNTDTPTPPSQCSVRADKDVQVHVGPGRERGIRAYLPKNQDVPVLGQAEDKQGNLWWQIQMPKIEQAWVADEDVTTRGDCDEAISVTPPPVMTPTTPGEPRAHTGVILALAVTSNGSKAISLSQDGTVKQWSLPDGKLLQKLEIPSQELSNVFALSPDGNWLAVTDEQNDIQVQPLFHDGRPVALSGHTAEITALAFSADAAFLASASRDQSIKLWSLADGERIGDFPAGDIDSLAFSPDGKLLVAAGAGKVELRALPDGALVHTFEGLPASKRWVITAASNVDVRSCPSPDCAAVDNLAPGETIQVLSTGGDWHEIRLRDGSQAYIFAPLTSPDRWTANRIAITPDGALLVMADNTGTVSAWSLSDNSPVEALNGLAGSVSALTISADGSLLAVADNTGTIQLWSPPDEELVATLKETAVSLQPGVLVTSLAFIPGDTGLIVGSSSGHLKLWSLDGELIALLLDKDATLFYPPPIASQGTPGTVPPGQTGINYTVQGQTFTLPCGSPLTPGAVCVCNCVTVPPACTCDAACSCDSVCTCAGASHYWYPN